MAELADALDLGSSVVRRVGSSPTSPTNILYTMDRRIHCSGTRHSDPSYGHNGEGTCQSSISKIYSDELEERSGSIPVNRPS